jgi:hypothetical protein
MTPSFFDLLALEKQVANKAKKQLASALKFAIDRTTYKKTGEATKSAGSRAVFKDNRLQRITLKAPHYIFKQNYGFEGTKKNGINMRLKSTGVLNIAIERSNVLETLANEISEIRLSQVTSKINFK